MNEVTVAGTSSISHWVAPALSAGFFQVWFQGSRVRTQVPNTHSDLLNQTFWDEA